MSIMSMRKYVRLVAVASICIVLPTVSHAAPAAQQLRFSVSPSASDPVWATPGIKFEKKGECAYSAATRPLASWPVLNPVEFSGATAPLFNPGFAQPDGTYIAGSADDGFNTLFVQIDSAAASAANSVVCRGTILANGVDVTAEAPDRLVASGLQTLSVSGPPTAKPRLDLRKFSVLTRPAPPTRTPVPVNQGKLIKSGSRPLQGNPLDRYRLDFETGETHLRPIQGHPDQQPGVDIQYSYTPAPGYIFRGRAVFAVDLPGSATPRGYVGCKAAKYSGSNGIVQTNSQNTYYCMLTPEGHIAEFKWSTNWKPGTGAPVALVDFWVWE